VPVKRKRGRPRLDPTPRRAEIVRAAVAVFSRYGYRNADLELVARRLRLAKGTIYLYFESKQDLFMAALASSVDALERAVAQAADSADGPVERIRAMVLAYFLFFDRDRRFAELVMRGQVEFLGPARGIYYRMYERNRARLRAELAAGVRLGCFRRVGTAETAEMLANIMLGTITTYLYGQHRGGTARTGRAVADFILQGLAKGNGLQ
jgi:TetR/AcrR family fatty acid metabolism transcriptional regulator